jgi:transcriptional regulator with XRE-family HTH domain
MAKPKPKSPITDPLRKAIDESGLPLLRLSKDAGVARASLIRFMRGETSLRLDVADKLAVFFGLRLDAVPTSKKATNGEAK